MLHKCDEEMGTPVRPSNSSETSSDLRKNELLRSTKMDYDSDSSLTLTEDDEFVDAMSTPHSDASSETYTISSNASADEEEELPEEPTQKEQAKKGLKFMSMKAVDDDGCSSVSSPEISETSTPEMAGRAEKNLKDVSANKLIGQNQKVATSSQKPQELGMGTKPPTHVEKSKEAPRTSHPPEAPAGQNPPKVSPSGTNAEKTLKQSPAKPSSPAVVPPKQASPKPPHTQQLPNPPATAQAPVQKTPVVVSTITPQAAASIAAAQAAAFQGFMQRSVSPAPAQISHTTGGSVSGKTAQKPPKPAQKQASIAAPAAVPAAPQTSASPLAKQGKVMQEAQVHAQQLVPKLAVAAPKKQESSSAAATQNISRSVSPPEPSPVPAEPVANKAPVIPNASASSAVPKDPTPSSESRGKDAVKEAISGGVAGEKAPVASGGLSVKSATNTGKSTGGSETLVTDQQISEKSMTESKVKELENVKVPSDAIMGLSVTAPPVVAAQKLAEEALPASVADDSKPTTGVQSETPRRPPPSIDSRTITRPPKVRVQQLPEAVVAPLSKAAPEITKQISAVNSGEKVAALTMPPLPPPVASSTPSRVPSQPQIPPSIVPQTQMPQQSVHPNPIPQQTPGAASAASIPLSQQTAHPKPTPQQAQSHQQTAAPIRNVTQPIVVPSTVIASLPDASAGPTQTAAPTAASATPQTTTRKQEHSRREGEKPSQRARQRTITVQSQVSLDITAAYNEVRQMNVDDPATELVRRVQAIVAIREKEWAAKNDKLAQLLAHEQRRNEPLEQKAAERLLAMGEYEKLVQEFVEELKKRSSDKNGTSLGGPKSIGGPGPERNLSPDDVAQLIKERDQLAEEVNSLETSYSELFRRYEKLRQTSIEIKQNEESVKSASEEMAKKYAILAEKFEMLRRNAEEQLDLANNEIERLIKQQEADTLGLRLKVKQLESKNDSLVVSLEARQKELENMTAIFEEVINKAEANDEAALDV